MVHQDQYVETESTANAGRLVMVCGAARSGTTMADLMLGNADNAFSKETDVAISNSVSGELIATGLEPLWYCQHILKALFRRFVPEHLPVND